MRALKVSRQSRVQGQQAAGVDGTWEVPSRGLGGQRSPGRAGAARVDVVGGAAGQVAPLPKANPVVPQPRRASHGGAEWRAAGTHAGRVPLDSPVPLLRPGGALRAAADNVAALETTVSSPGAAATFASPAGLSAPLGSSPRGSGGAPGAATGPSASLVAMVSGHESAGRDSLASLQGAERRQGSAGHPADVVVPTPALAQPPLASPGVAGETRRWPGTGEPINYEEGALLKEAAQIFGNPGPASRPGEGGPGATAAAQVAAPRLPDPTERPAAEKQPSAAAALPAAMPLTTGRAAEPVPELLPERQARGGGGRVPLGAAPGSEASAAPGAGPEWGGARGAAGAGPVLAGAPMHWEDERARWMAEGARLEREALLRQAWMDGFERGLRMAQTQGGGASGSGGGGVSIGSMGLRGSGAGGTYVGYAGAESSAGGVGENGAAGLSEGDAGGGGEGARAEECVGGAGLDASAGRGEGARGVPDRAAVEPGGAPHAAAAVDDPTVSREAKGVVESDGAGGVPVSVVASGTRAADVEDAGLTQEPLRSEAERGGADGDSGDAVAVGSLPVSPAEARAELRVDEGAAAPLAPCEPETAASQEPPVLDAADDQRPGDAEGSVGDAERVDEMAGGCSALSGEGKVMTGLLPDALAQSLSVMEGDPLAQTLGVTKGGPLAQPLSDGEHCGSEGPLAVQGESRDIDRGRMAGEMEEEANGCKFAASAMGYGSPEGTAAAEAGELPEPPSAPMTAGSDGVGGVEDQPLSLLEAPHGIGSGDGGGEDVPEGGDGGAAVGASAVVAPRLSDKLEMEVGGGASDRPGMEVDGVVADGASLGVPDRAEAVAEGSPAHSPVHWPQAPVDRSPAHSPAHSPQAPADNSPAHSPGAAAEGAVPARDGDGGSGGEQGQDGVVDHPPPAVQPDSAPAMGSFDDLANRDSAERGSRSDAEAGQMGPGSVGREGPDRADADATPQPLAAKGGTGAEHAVASERETRAAVQGEEGAAEGATAQDVPTTAHEGPEAANDGTATAEAAADAAANAPAPADPAAADPAAINPAATDPAATDPAATDPAATDPAATDPARGVGPLRLLAAVEGAPEPGDTDLAVAARDLEDSSSGSEDEGQCDGDRGGGQGDSARTPGHHAAPISRAAGSPLIPMSVSSASSSATSSASSSASSDESDDGGETTSSGLSSGSDSSDDSDSDSDGQERQRRRVAGGRGRAAAGGRGTKTAGRGLGNGAAAGRGVLKQVTKVAPGAGRGGVGGRGRGRGGSAILSKAIGGGVGVASAKGSQARKARAGKVPGAAPKSAMGVTKAPTKALGKAPAKAPAKAQGKAPSKATGRAGKEAGKTAMGGLTEAAGGDVKAKQPRVGKGALLRSGTGSPAGGGEGVRGGARKRPRSESSAGHGASTGDEEGGAARGTRAAERAEVAGLATAAAEAASGGGAGAGGDVGGGREQDEDRGRGEAADTSVTAVDVDVRPSEVPEPPCEALPIDRVGAMAPVPDLPVPVAVAPPEAPSQPGVSEPTGPAVAGAVMMDAVAHLGSAPSVGAADPGPVGSLATGPLQSAPFDASTSPGVLDGPPPAVLHARAAVVPAPIALTQPASDMAQPPPLVAALQQILTDLDVPPPPIATVVSPAHNDAPAVDDSPADALRSSPLSPPPLPRLGRGAYGATSNVAALSRGLGAHAGRPPLAAAIAADAPGCVSGRPESWPARDSRGGREGGDGPGRGKARPGFEDGRGGHGSRWGRAHGPGELSWSSPRGRTVDLDDRSARGLDGARPAGEGEGGGHPASVALGPLEPTGVQERPVPAPEIGSDRGQREPGRPPAEALVKRPARPHAAPRDAANAEVVLTRRSKASVASRALEEAGDVRLLSPRGSQPAWGGALQTADGDGDGLGQGTLVALVRSASGGAASSPRFGNGDALAAGAGGVVPAAGVAGHRDGGAGGIADVAERSGGLKRRNSESALQCSSGAPSAVASSPATGAGSSPAWAGDGAMRAAPPAPASLQVVATSIPETQLPWESEVRLQHPGDEGTGDGGRAKARKRRKVVLEG